jgi:hypothetical protein
MPRELDISVETVLIDQLKDLSPSHGHHLLCYRETTIVPHNSANESRSKQHVRSFDEMNLGPLLTRRERGGTPCPTSTHDDDLHCVIPPSLFSIRS